MNKKWLLGVLIFVSIILNAFFRLNSYFLPALSKQAREEIDQQFALKAKEMILRTYPDLEAIAEGRYVDSLVKQMRKEKQAELIQATRIRTKWLKDFYRDDQGFTYLLETDPYRWLRRVEAFLSTGHFGSLVRAGQEYDAKASFPEGRTIEPLKLHFLLGAYWHAFLHRLNPGLSLRHSLAIFPVVLSAIVVILIFVVSLQFGITYRGSFVASLATGLCVLAIGRTTYGWFDTDIYNLIMPLCIFSSAAAGFKRTGLKSWAYFILSGVSVGLYSGFWSIWWLFFYIILAGMSLNAFDVFISGPQEKFSQKMQKAIMPVALYVLASYASVFLVSGLQALGRSFSDPFLYLTIRRSMTLDDFWPNLAFSISEVKKANILTLTVLLGGPIIFYGGLLGQIAALSVRRDVYGSKEKRGMIFILFIWFLTALFLTNFGARFIFLLIIPIGLYFGLLGDVFAWLIEKISSTNAKVKGGLLWCLVGLMSAVPIYNALQFDTFPVFMNDSVWGMMNKIKELTPEDALILASWDTGDYIMTVAQRATVHDAGWQFSPVPYWFDRAVTAQSETEALSILRMLSSGGNRAFQELAKLCSDDKFAAMEILNTMLSVSKGEARKLLSARSNDAALVESIVKNMYEPKTSAYLLIDTQMANTISVLGLIGKWDFNKLQLWRISRSASKDSFISSAKGKFGYSDEAAATLYRQLRFIEDKDALYWISNNNYHLFQSSQYQKIQKDQGVGSMAMFENGLAMDTDSLRSYYYDSAHHRWIVPGYSASLFNGELKISDYPSGDKRYAAFFAQEGDEGKVSLLSKELFDCVFFRLYFAQGAGLKHFTLLHREFVKGREKLLLYKIDWDTTS